MACDFMVLGDQVFDIHGVKDHLTFVNGTETRLLCFIPLRSLCCSKADHIPEELLRRSPVPLA